VVIDADAITAAGEGLACLEGRKGVITPHHGEFKALTGRTVPSDVTRAKAVVSEEARRVGLTLLLKGREDIVSDGERVKVVRGGNPGMTVGGTGDVLTGVVAGLVSKGAQPFNAARLGAFINKMAGEFAFREKSYGLMPKDLVERIPKVLIEFLEPRRAEPVPRGPVRRGG
jgi:NAD(P)H-hydrate epimerase